VAIAQDEHGLSRRRACRLIGITRSVVERAPKREQDHQRLRECLRALAGERRRFGYRWLHELLRREGFMANHKLVERLCREEKLAIRPFCRLRTCRCLRSSAAVREIEAFSCSH
jgi:putative transposase